MKTIYSKWLAYELRRRGFQIVSSYPNPHKPQYDCYDFEETPELIAAFTELTAARRRLIGNR